jgi:hypothetical protein
MCIIVEQIACDRTAPALLFLARVFEAGGDPAALKTILS